MTQQIHIITQLPLTDMRLAYLNRAFCLFVIAVSRRICHLMRISQAVPCESVMRISYANHAKWQIYSVQSMLAANGLHRMKGEKQCLLN